jgi:hypothetical protein
MQINLHPSQVLYPFFAPALASTKYLQDTNISPVMYRHKLFFFCELSHHLTHTGAEIWELYNAALTWYSIQKVHIMQSFTSDIIFSISSPYHNKVLTFYKGHNESWYYRINISLFSHINSTCQAYLSTYIEMYTQIVQSGLWQF